MAFGKNKPNRKTKEPEKPKDEPKKLPVARITAGHVKLTVWENEGEYGSMYSAVLIKRYKNDDEWKETASIDSSDFLAAAQCFEKAWRMVQDGKGQWVEEVEQEVDKGG